MRKLRLGDFVITEFYSPAAKQYVFQVTDQNECAVYGRDAERIVAEAMSKEYGGGVYFKANGDSIFVHQVDA